MYLEIIKTAVIYNQNIGLIKDFVAEKRILEGSFKNRLNFIKISFILFWILFTLKRRFDYKKPLVNNGYVYDTESHLNGSSDVYTIMHISKVAFNRRVKFKNSLFYAKKTSDFIRQLNRNGLYVKNLRAYMVYTVYSMFVNVENEARKIALGWDDNWRSGAIIKHCRENNIDCCVYQHGLVANSFRYIPYSSRFSYFEVDFPDLVKNPLNVKLSTFKYKSRLKNIRFCQEGKEVIFLTKLSFKNLAKVNKSKDQIVIYHPLQEFSEPNEKDGFFLREIQDLKIKKAFCMKSTIIYDLKYLKIPVEEIL